MKTPLLPAVAILSTALSAMSPRTLAGDYAEYRRFAGAMPGLIRFYTFDEGSGDEVVNHVAVDPKRIAVTGGPFGSMTVVRPNPYGWRCLGKERPEYNGPRWIDEGRFPGKHALRSGTNEAMLYRSCISGRELQQGATFAMWVRTMGGEDFATEFLRLGDAYGTGFVLAAEYRKWCQQGRVALRFGAADPSIKRSLSLDGLEPGLWHFVAFTVDGRRAALRVDDAVAEIPFEASIVSPLTEPYPRADKMNEVQERIVPAGGWPTFLRIGYHRGREEHADIFDLDELLVFDRALDDGEIGELRQRGAPTEDADAQKTAFNEVESRRAANDGIRIFVPDDTSGYFRKGAPITVSVTVPDDPRLEGPYTARVSMEQMQGAFRKRREFAVARGKTETCEFLPDACGIYFVEADVVDASGAVVRRLDPMRVVAVTAPVPKGGLTSTNPIGLWAFNNDFSYDSPVRRMMICHTWRKEDRAEYSIREFENYRKITPELRSFICFGYPTKGKLLSQMDPEELDSWHKYFDEVIEVAKKVNTYAVEFMSEPDCDRTTPDSAAETIEYLAPLFRKALPNARLVPAGACPTGLPWTDQMMAHGVAPLVDGISYHSYRGNPIMEMNLANPLKPINDILDKYPGKTYEHWNTESGYDILPRVGKRPMTAAEARDAQYPVGDAHGYEMFTTSMPCAPEEDAAALQVHAILCEFALGFKSYAKCIAPNTGVSPSLQGVAWTALAGQVMNHMTSVTRMPLSSLNMACFLVKQDDGSTIAAVCGMKPETVNLRLEPDKTYRTMTMLGDFGTVTTDAGGILPVNAGMNPFYIFGVPDSISESSVLRIDMPRQMPEDGILRGTVRVSNDFGAPFEGTLRASESRGMAIDPASARVALQTGESREFPFTVKSISLRNRAYVAGFELEAEGKTVAAAAAPFESPGTITTIPSLPKAPAMDADPTFWKDIPATTYDQLDDVSHGIPNLACLWLPHWLGKDDLSCSVRYGYVRDDAIYFLLEVTDDVVFPCPPDANQPFRYDSLELFTDLRPVKEQGSPRSAGADQHVVSAPNVDGPVPLDILPCCRAHESPFASVTATGRRTGNGYLIEGRIAPREGVEFKLRPGSRLRMDFTIDDTDVASELRKAAITFHGSFNNYIRVDFWGKFELGL